LQHKEFLTPPFYVKMATCMKTLVSFWETKLSSSLGKHYVSSDTNLVWKVCQKLLTSHFISLLVKAILHFSPYSISSNTALPNLLTSTDTSSAYHVGICSSYGKTNYRKIKYLFLLC
jgi:hypothetical protein